MHIALIAFGPIVGGICCLLLTKHVLSKDQTWDLLFNLTGAWHLRFGHIIHRDFHEYLGELNFLFTYWGFSVFGTTPRAFLMGPLIVATGLFLTAIAVTWRRLPLFPAALFVVFVCFLVLAPASLGELPSRYSFAMSYNRYGWAVLSVISLVLLLPPRTGPQSADWLDIGTTSVLLIFLFYVKITYFLVGVVGVVLSCVACAHVKARMHAWALVAGATLVLAAWPSNWPYIQDVIACVAACQGGKGVNLYFINILLGHAGEYAPYVVVLFTVVWLWIRKLTTLHMVFAVGFVFFGSLWLLFYNTQAHSVPLLVIIAFLLYDYLREGHLEKTRLAVVLMALLVFPLMFVATSASSLVGYAVEAGTSSLEVVRETNLQGLAVRRQEYDVLSAFQSGDYQLFSQARASDRFEITPHEYVQTLMEAAELLSPITSSGQGIVLFDQVNPLPFMLKLPPPCGGNLWFERKTPAVEDAAYLGEAQYVLVPKFPTSIRWTEFAIAKYGPYLREKFAIRIESPSWTLFSRKGVQPSATCSHR